MNHEKKQDHRRTELHTCTVGGNSEFIHTCSACVRAHVHGRCNMYAHQCNLFTYTDCDSITLTEHVPYQHTFQQY